jgi:hypothetical protein
MRPSFALCPFALALLAAGACNARAEGEGPSAEKGYTLTAAVDPTPPKKDARAAWQVTIAPKAPWVLKTTTPLTVTLKPSPTVKPEKATLKAEDIVDGTTEAKTVRTGFVATATGDASLDADLSFFLCTDQICQRFKDSVKVGFKVE